MSLPRVTDRQSRPERPKGAGCEALPIRLILLFAAALLLVSCSRTDGTPTAMPQVSSPPTSTVSPDTLPTIRPSPTPTAMVRLEPAVAPTDTPAPAPSSPSIRATASVTPSRGTATPAPSRVAQFWFSSSGPVPELGASASVEGDTVTIITSVFGPVSGISVALLGHDGKADEVQRGSGGLVATHIYRNVHPGKYLATVSGGNISFVEELTVKGPTGGTGSSSTPPLVPLRIVNVPERVRDIAGYLLYSGASRQVLEESPAKRIGELGPVFTAYAPPGEYQLVLAATMEDGSQLISRRRVNLPQTIRFEDEKNPIPVKVIIDGPDDLVLDAFRIGLDPFPEAAVRPLPSQMLAVELRVPPLGTPVQREFLLNMEPGRYAFILGFQAGELFGLLRTNVLDVLTGTEKIRLTWRKHDLATWRSSLVGFERGSVYVLDTATGMGAGPAVAYLDRLSGVALVSPGEFGGQASAVKQDPVVSWLTWGYTIETANPLVLAPGQLTSTRFGGAFRAVANTEKRQYGAGDQVILWFHLEDEFGNHVKSISRHPMAKELATLQVTGPNVDIRQTAVSASGAFAIPLPATAAGGIYTAKLGVDTGPHGGQLEVTVLFDVTDGRW